MNNDELTSLAMAYVAGLARLEEAFFSAYDGVACLRGRAALVDTLVTSVFADYFAGVEGVTLCAVGGYGRRELFPCSDVDLLVLVNEAPDEAMRERLRSCFQALWDAHLRISHSVRTPAECGALHEGNAEFTLSLLDLRFLAGDAAMPQRLQHELLPRMIRRERVGLLRRLDQLIRDRHHRFSDTVYHLEPNIKDAPGGLRDLHSQAWWRTLQETTTELLPQEARTPSDQCAELHDAQEFLIHLRTFLHYQNGRDINIFSYDLQENLAAGPRWEGKQQAPALWMREYFGHARWVAHRLQRLLHISAGRRNTLFRFVQQKRHEVATPDFAVIGGEVNFRNPRFVAHQPELLIDIFRFAAEHQGRLSDAAEATVRQAIPQARAWFAENPQTWALMRNLLLSPTAYESLSAMHHLGLLGAVVPEFEAIDCYVQRDYHHRYTVDEHSLLTIQAIHRLRHPESELDRRFLQLYEELDRPEILLLTLLLHDVGKGAGTDDHLTPGVEAASRLAQRWQLDEPASELIRFLIQNHLALSRALRRDIFDAENVMRVAEQTASEERLKMLTLLTLADIQAVHPEALTPWKEENLWQLYMAVCAQLTRGLDQDRIGSPHLHAQQTAHELLASTGAAIGADDLAAYLDGLPRRYLATCSPNIILEHFRRSRDLSAEQARVVLARRSIDYELSVIAWDRPRLFATVAGVLASYGATILKAEAFANRQGIIVDHFRFLDLSRNFELNAGELDRFRRQLEHAVTAPLQLERLQAPARRWFARSSGPPIATRIHFDGAAAGRRTLVEIITRDRPGLLFDIARVLAENECDIDVAVIDTESARAIDAFYLSQEGQALRPEVREKLQRDLQQLLETPRGA